MPLRCTLENYLVDRDDCFPQDLSAPLDIDCPYKSYHLCDIACLEEVLQRREDRLDDIPCDEWEQYQQDFAEAATRISQGEPAPSPWADEPVPLFLTNPRLYKSKSGCIN